MGSAPNVARPDVSCQAGVIVGGEAKQHQMASRLRLIRPALQSLASALGLDGNRCFDPGKARTTLFPHFRDATRATRSPEAAVPRSELLS